MSIKNLLLLAAVTGAFAFAAVKMQGDSADAGAPAEDALFVPELRKSINDVATVKIQGQTETFTLERTTSGWGMQEKGGYPVDGAKIRAYLLGLAEAARIERKTDDPARYERLGVQDVEAEGSNSTLVTVTSNDSRELASMIVGKMRTSKGGDGGPAYFARPTGEPASWLVGGDLKVDTTPKNWLDPEIVEVPRDSIVAARIEHADGEVVACTKTDPDAQYPTLEGIPEGKEPTFEGVASRFTSALERLRLDDVEKDGTTELPDPAQATATFWTKDGLKVTVHASEIESKLYCRFQAEYDENVPGAEAVADEGPPAPEDEEAAPQEDPKRSPEEVRKEAEAIQAKVAGWTYILPTYKKTAFMSRMSELVRDIPAPTPPPVETPAPTDETEDGGDPGPGATDETTDPPIDETTDPPTTDPPTPDPETGGSETEEGGGEGGGA